MLQPAARIIKLQLILECLCVVSKLTFLEVIKLLAYTSTRVPSDTVLAVWTFIHPAILAHADRFVQQLQLAKPSYHQLRAGDPTTSKTGTAGYLSLGRVKLSQDRLQDLGNHLNKLRVPYDAKGNDMVRSSSSNMGTWCVCQQGTCINMRTWRIVSKLPGTSMLQPTGAGMHCHGCMLPGDCWRRLHGCCCCGEECHH